MKTCYPLFEFYSDISEPFKIAKGIEIVPNAIDLSKINKINLSEEDVIQIPLPNYCLQIDNDMARPEGASLLFMVACRLLKRTKVFIRYRVDVDDRVLKVVDRYPFVNSKEATHVLRQNECASLPILYSRLKKFSSLSRRTRNAFYFLRMACISRGWLESLLFYVCALETLTSSSEREGKITEKFIGRIHSFTGYSERKLEKIYNVRSELIHGRYSYSAENKNLKWFRVAEEVCRKMFNKILLDSACLDSLKDEKSRMALFGSTVQKTDCNVG